MKERIQKLQREIWKFTLQWEKDYFSELLEIISDLAHKVQELEPEHISEEEVAVYNKEVEEQEYKLDIEATTRKQRDKLARQLVEAILQDRGMHPPKVLALADQLKVKLDAGL